MMSIFHHINAACIVPLYRLYFFLPMIWFQLFILSCVGCLEFFSFCCIELRQWSCRSAWPSWFIAVQNNTPLIFIAGLTTVSWNKMGSKEFGFWGLDCTFLYDDCLFSSYLQARSIVWFMSGENQMNLLLESIQQRKTDKSVCPVISSYCNSKS